VSLVETVSVGSRRILGMREVFSCWAKDFEHAEEQARNAYPNCFVISIDKEN